MKSELIWIAQTEHPAHGTAWRAFRGETPARAWVAARRRQGFVATWMVMMMVLE